MIVPDELRKCVAFIGCNTASGLKLLGTAFLVAFDLADTGRNVSYLVTAKHLIHAIGRRSSDGKVCIRLNLRDGGTELGITELSDWKFHPSDATVDVAAIQIALPTKFDHLSYPASGIATREIITKEEIGLGEEVFLTGLFHRHAGTKKNIPIIRTGNIAAMPEEPVDTEMFGPMEAYLVEARSIGGLSGSPVFVHLGIVRIIGGELRHSPSTAGRFYLLGLMHGHWEMPLIDVDYVKEDDVKLVKANMGIAVVVPADKILQVLNQPCYLAERQRMEKELKEQNAPASDV